MTADRKPEDNAPVPEVNPAQAPPAARQRKCRVVFVAPYPLFQAKLNQVIHRQEDFVVCAEAHSMPAARAAVEKWKPYIVVLELVSGEKSGLEMLASLRAEFPGLRILALSDRADEASAEEALRCGADGYLLKSEVNHEALDALQTVLDGDLYISPSMMSPLLRWALQNSAHSSLGLGALTERELQVLSLLGDGLKTGKIAAQLHLSRKTAAAHLQNIQHKLALPSAVELARFAREGNHAARLHPSAQALEKIEASPNQSGAQAGTPPAASAQKAAHSVHP